MEMIKEEYTPTDGFIMWLNDLTWNEFAEKYGDDHHDLKKLRNDYVGRIYKKNQMFYYLDWIVDEKNEEIRKLNNEIIKIRAASTGPSGPSTADKVKKILNEHH
jgi:hypothetical protein